MSRIISRLLPGLVFGAVILVPVAWILWLGFAGEAPEETMRAWKSTDLQGLLANSIFLALEHWESLPDDELTDAQRDAVEEVRQSRADAVEQQEEDS